MHLQAAAQNISTCILLQATAVSLSTSNIMAKRLRQASLFDTLSKKIHQVESDGGDEVNEECLSSASNLPDIIDMTPELDDHELDETET